LPAAELEVASPRGVAEVLMPAEVVVPLGPGAAEDANTSRSGGAIGAGCCCGADGSG
jgi:hypothetical protein